MSDEYRQRMMANTDELHAQGVGRYASAPPLYRLAWRLGLQVRPPLYQSSTTLAVALGVFFGAGWALAMWLIDWRAEPPTLAHPLGWSLLVGVLFGGIMAAYYRWKAQRLQLPPLHGSRP